MYINKSVAKMPIAPGHRFITKLFCLIELQTDIICNYRTNIKILMHLRAWCP